MLNGNRRLKLSKLSLIYWGIAFLGCVLLFVSDAFFSGSKVMYDGDGSDLSILSYERGVYAIDVDYSSDCYGMISLTPSSDLDQWGASYKNAFMPDYSNHVTSYLYINQSDSQFEIAIYPVQESDSFNVSHVCVVRMRVRSAVYRAFRMFVCFLVIYLISYVIFELRKGTKDKNNINNRLLIFGMFLLTLISMMGFMQSYIPGGQDAEFHLARIASIAEVISSGSFPVRIYPCFVNDYGYPLGIMYGDMFLYPSALLHLIGMPLWKSYVFYVAMISAITVIIANYSFGEMTGDRNIGFIGSVIYTLSIWRLNDVYIRAAAGEYAAMAFLPLVVLGFYKLFSNIDEDDKKRDDNKVLLYLVIGYFGLIQTHMLTTIITTVFLSVIGIALCRRILVKSKLMLILKSAGIAFLANLCFIIPVIDYYRSYDLAVEHQSVNIQDQGAYLSQLFMTGGLFSGGSYSLQESYGINGEMPLGIGLTMLIILGILLFVIIIDNKNKYRTILGICGVVAMISIWMSTCYFPYDFIARRIGFLARIINRVQFPWRYSVITTMALSVASVFLIKYFKEKERTQFLIISVSLLLITVVQAVSFISERLETNEYYISADCVDQIAASLIDNDTLYWIQGMSRDDLDSREIITSSEAIKGLVIREEVSSVDIAFSNTSDSNGWIEPPILAYKGYHAYYQGDELQIQEGDNYRIRVEVPSADDGVISIRFIEPMIWRIGEVISLLTWILVAVWVLRCSKSRC